MTRHVGCRTSVEFGATPGPAHGRGLGRTYAWVGPEANNRAACTLVQRAGGAAQPFVLYGWPLDGG